ncbi:hypothetical protein BCU98_19770 [Vibrio splendidus]|nr:hypothetical protein BCU98_19770 [Vibrio splendidus]
MWALVDEYQNVIGSFSKERNNSYFGNKLDFNELSDQYKITFFIERGYLAQSIHYHSVGMVIALELHVHFYMNISFEVSIR